MKKKIATKAALKAGKILMKNFRSGVAPERKKGRELVVKADLESEKVILKIIQEKCPLDNIISEEMGKIDKGSAYTWFIDPLDGTGNYAMGNPFFAVSLALAHQEEVILGVIYLPYFKTLFWAEKDQGAFYQDNLGGISRAIQWSRKMRVSEQSNFDNAFLVFCQGTEKDFKRMANLYHRLRPAVWDLRKLGSAACECVYVAQGKAEAYLTTKIRPFDVAAGILLVEEAGGRVTNWQGQPWNLNLGQSDLLVSNGRIHQKLLNLIKDL
jgi:myo-inositol-1(or 4)-monophosphatase